MDKGKTKNTRNKRDLTTLKKTKRNYSLERKSNYKKGTINKRNTKINKNRQDIDIHNYLKMICSDSCGCLVFSRENEKINQMFEGFRHFRFALEPHSYRRGKASANGFGYEIVFKRFGYEVSTLLKSSVQKNSDNLYYEYLVGVRFINIMNNFFPCFTETYDILQNKSQLLKTNMINADKHISTLDIKKNYSSLYTNSNPKNSLISCTKSDELAILVQYVKNPQSFEEFAVNRDNLEEEYYSNTLTQLLFQVYGPLTQIRDIYTHYDLHGDNVLLYNLSDKTCINMNYVYKNKITISFKTDKISKIIDFGRSHFKSKKGGGSAEIQDIISKEITCQDDANNLCGNGSNGYQLKASPSKECHWISPLYSNISHDLRLAFNMKFYYDEIKLDSNIKRIFEAIEYEDIYGTPENKSFDNNKILNVKDMEKALAVLMMSDEFKIANNKLYSTHQCIGNLTINMDGTKQMNFVDNTK